MLRNFFRVLSAGLFLSAVLFTIPLAFDVGGRTCGLAFSLSLFLYYGFMSIIRLATPEHSRLRITLVRLFVSLQWLVVPTLMILCLNKFSVDSDIGEDWAHRTFDYKRASHESIQSWLFGIDGLVQSLTIGAWDKTLRWSIPFFQLAEGFCSLLVIQAAGQITKYLVNRDNGDHWMIGLLVVSASIISSSIYFLYRITTFPELENVDAVLIGAAVTCAIFLCARGIATGRGNPVESSLLFAYVTLCIYQIFTDYRPANPVSADLISLPPQTDFPPFPPIIMASYTTIVHLLSSLPNTLHSAFHFLVAVIMTITPSVIISLAYRVFVMYASTRIIPAIRESGARALSQEPSLDDHDEVGQVLGFVSWFSPSLLIAVYTSILMQHFSSTSGTGAGGEWWASQGGQAHGNIWRWGNLALTMFLYGVELYMSRRENDSLTSHWKVD